MYEEEFGTDWQELTQEEAIERAFALGVAASLGEEHPGELDRLVDEAASAYGRSIVKLAYEEGESRARKRERGAEEEDVWEETVGEIEEEEPVEVTTEPPEGIPRSVSRIDLLDPPGDDLDRVRLPEFLRR